MDILDSMARNAIPFTKLGDPKAVREGSERTVLMPNGQKVIMVSLNGKWVTISDDALEYTADTLPDPATLAPGTAINVEGVQHLVSDGEYVSALNYLISVERYGATGNGVDDDTDAWLAAIATGRDIALVNGKRYKVTDSIICAASNTRLSIYGNGAEIHASFGVNYSKPLFKNDSAANSTCCIELRDLKVTGNCVMVNQEFAADSPNAGLSLLIDNVEYNTGDGNRRPGTAAVLASSIDFVQINKLVVWNSDMGVSIGALFPKRNSTQVRMSNVQISQVNTGCRLRGCDKVDLSSVDIMTCNSGFTFGGNLSRVRMELCHVENIAVNANYANPSIYADPVASGKGYHFEDSVQWKDVVMEQCSVIDTGGSGGTATAGVYIGRTITNQPDMQAIRLIDCEIAKTMAGSPNYKPIRNRGQFKWHGRWPYITECQLAENGVGYLDMEIIDSSMNPSIPNWNLFRGNTVLSLLEAQGTAPTITEVVPSSVNKTYGHKVSFNAACELYQHVVCPYGWVTVDVVGYCIQGNPLLYAQNSTTWANAFKVQFTGVSDAPRRWRICFFNEVANQVYRIGLTNQSAVAGNDQCVIHSFTAYQGLPRENYPMSDVELVSSLPTPSQQWFGKRMIVRASGVADTMFVGVTDASANNVFKKITLV